MRTRLLVLTALSALLAPVGACTPTGPEPAAASTASVEHTRPESAKSKETGDGASATKSEVGAGGRVEDGFFMVDDAPDPRACQAASDCVGDTIPDANGCCQDPRRVSSYSREYKRFIADWRKTACVNVTCPPPPAPSLPPRCVFEPRCVDGQCADSCPPKWLGPVDLKCEGDADCAATQEFYETKDGCCRSCGTMAAIPTWIDEAARICSERGSTNCPVKKCAPLDDAACVKGQCRVVARGR